MTLEIGLIFLFKKYKWQNFLMFYSSLLRFLIEAVEDVEHGVLGSDVAPGLGAALGVDGAAHVAELTEEVEGVEHHSDICLGKVTRDTCVPYQLVGVH